MTDMQTTNNISDIFNNTSDGVVVLYDGIWGIGKTYDWLHHIAPALTADKKYYVSLFGLKNTDAIKEALISDYIRQNNHPVGRALLFLIFLLSSFYFSFPYQEKFFNLTPWENFNSFYCFIFLGFLVFVLGWAAWHAFTIFDFIFYKYIGQSPKDLLINMLIKDGSVICFDDFERLSDDNVKKEALAYFSKLSKERKMKILVIANYHALQKTDETTAPDILYKEKVFDYYFKKIEGYDFVREVKEKLSDYPKAREVFLRFYTQLEMPEYSPVLAKNFRICKRVLRNVKRFCKEVKKFHHLPDNYYMAVRYIIRISFLNELGKNALISNSRYYQINRDAPDELKPEDVIEMLAFDDNYHNLVYFPELEKFILGDKFDYTKFKNELYPEEQDELTDFEQRIFKIKAEKLYNMRQRDIEKLLAPAEKILKVPEEDLFSDIFNIMPVFSRYSCVIFVLYPEDAAKHLNLFIERIVKEFNKFSNYETELLLSEIWNRDVLGNYFLGEKHRDIVRQYTQRIKKTLIGILYLKAFFDPEKLSQDMLYNIPAAIAQLWGLSKKMLLQTGLNELFEDDFSQYLDLLRNIAEFLDREKETPICREINLAELVKSSLIASLDFAFQNTPADAHHDLKLLHGIRDRLA